MAARARKPVLLGFLCLIALSAVRGHAGEATGGDCQRHDQDSPRSCASGRELRRIPARLPADPPSQPPQPSIESLPDPNDPAYHDQTGENYIQWPAHALDAVQAWGSYPAEYFDAARRPGQTPIVAVIDTGVDPNHPDFLNPGAASAAVDDGGQLMLSASYTFLPSGGDVAGQAHDEHGHGTHLAGLIAAGTNNGTTAGSGIAGLGYPVRLLPIKVANESGVATHADISRAIRYAADQDASVILIGMVGPTWSRALQDAVDYAWNRGCLLVAPAGDAVSDQPMFPASCPHVFGVAATTVSGALAAYCSQGASVALAAPGGDGDLGVYSTLPTYVCTLRTDLTGPAYGWQFGTAQAAAHTAAAAGLWAATNAPQPITGEEGKSLWQALQQTAAADGAITGWQPNRGYGRLSPVALLAGTPAAATATGSIVGRVLCSDAPRLDLPVTATPSGGTGSVASATVWPAGGYRIDNLQPGVYRLEAFADDKLGVWEAVEVKAGCDVPGVDFRLGDTPGQARPESPVLPEAAVCGRELPLSLTFRNTGEGGWTRAHGYCLLGREGDQWGLSPDEEIAPGQQREFAVLWRAPALYGFYELSWQMCQQGGVGRFGESADGLVSVTSFLDVRADHWAVSAIEALKGADIVRGFGEDLYGPDYVVSRGQMAVYIARVLAGGEDAVPPAPATASFSDVDASYWAYRYIEYAKACDVVRGYGDEYRPEEPVDRGQMAVFVSRGIAGGEGGLPETPPDSPPFPDVPLDYWACKYISYLKAASVVGGYPDGLYHPERYCTRDQMAVYITRAFELPVL